MIILSKVLHTSRPIEIEDTARKIAKNYEKVLGLKKGTVKVTMTEHALQSPCKTNDKPHVHYSVTIGYDETNRRKI